MTAVVLNDNTKLFMRPLPKNKAGREKRTLYIPDLITLLSSFSGCGENLNQLGSCCLLQYGLFVLPQTLDATITDIFFRTNKHLKTRNINNSFRKAAISFLIITGVSAKELDFAE